MPSYTCNGSLDLVGVFENHHGFGGDIFICMLSCFAREILFKEINLVVLSDALGDSTDHLFGGLGEAQSGISVHLLGVLCLIGWLGRIDVCGPTTLSMPHSLV